MIFARQEGFIVNIYSSAAQLAGHTPLLELTRIERTENLDARILGKLEYLNPSGSVKDRVAKAMIETAEASGQLRPGGTIIESSSGSMGIGLVSAAAAKGYRVIITMPNTMSIERRRLLRAYGAELVLTEGGMADAIDKAERLAREIPGSYLPRQFANPANPAVHRASTGPEIWEDTGGQVDIFVAGVGTGGTITGVGQYLKGQNPAISIAAVEPAASPVLSGGTAGNHQLQGIGAGLIPAVLDIRICDEIIAVKDEDAFALSRQLGRLEGILVGASSGAAVWAAVQLARRPGNRGKTIVALLPDSGERYLSTSLFSAEGEN